MKKQGLFFEEIVEGSVFSSLLSLIKDDVLAYCRIVRDKNSIHQGEKAVVPGALLIGMVSGMVSELFAGECLVTNILVKFKSKLEIDKSNDVSIYIRIEKKQSRDKIGSVSFDIEIKNSEKIFLIGNGTVWVKRLVDRKLIIP